MNGYIALWNDKRCEVHAETSRGAQIAATAEFQKGTRKKVKEYEVSVHLAEKNGEQVTHVATN